MTTEEHQDDYEDAQKRRASAASPVEVTEDLQDRVLSTLTGAFESDPVMNWFLRQDDHRKRALRGLIGTQLPRYVSDGWAISANDGSCATLWSKPGKAAGSLGLAEQLRLLPRMAGMTGIRRLPRILKVMSVLEENHPKTPDHYYLFMIGVHPDHQGQGLGSSILGAALERVDAEGMPAYLENSNPKNSRLYQRHGFEILRDIHIAPGGPHLWPMWRDAKK